MISMLPQDDLLEVQHQQLPGGAYLRHKHQALGDSGAEADDGGLHDEGHVY